MEENQIETLDSDTQFSQPSDMPKFLKILCILSFVSGGFMVAFSGVGLLLQTSITELLYSAMDMVQTDVEALSFQHIIDNYRFTMFLTLFGYMGSLVGVMLMYKLRKIGFHIYTAAHVLMVALPAIMIDVPEEIDSGILGVVLGSIGTIAFIVMYALNLKHLKN